MGRSLSSVVFLVFALSDLSIAENAKTQMAAVPVSVTKAIDAEEATLDKAVAADRAAANAVAAEASVQQANQAAVFKLKGEQAAAQEAASKATADEDAAQATVQSATLEANAAPPDQQGAAEEAVASAKAKAVSLKTAAETAEAKVVNVTHEVEEAQDVESSATAAVTKKQQIEKQAETVTSHLHDEADAAQSVSTALTELSAYVESLYTELGHSVDERAANIMESAQKHLQARKAKAQSEVAAMESHISTVGETLHQAANRSERKEDKKDLKELKKELEKSRRHLKELERESTEQAVREDCHQMVNNEREKLQSKADAVTTAIKKWSTLSWEVHKMSKSADEMDLRASEEAREQASHQTEEVHSAAEKLIKAFAQAVTDSVEAHIKLAEAQTEVEAVKTKSEAELKEATQSANERFSAARNSLAEAEQTRISHAKALKDANASLAELKKYIVNVQTTRGNATRVAKIFSDLRKKAAKDLADRRAELKDSLASKLHQLSQMSQQMSSDNSSTPAAFTDKWDQILDEVQKDRAAVAKLKKQSDSWKTDSVEQGEQAERENAKAVEDAAIGAAQAVRKAASDYAVAQKRTGLRKKFYRDEYKEMREQSSGLKEEAEKRAREADRAVGDLFEAVRMHAHDVTLEQGPDGSRAKVTDMMTIDIRRYPASSLLACASAVAVFVALAVAGPSQRRTKMVQAPLLG